MRTFRFFLFFLLVTATLGVSGARAETAYNLLNNGICANYDGAVKDGCEYYWVSRIKEGLDKSSALSACKNKCIKNNSDAAKSFLCQKACTTIYNTYDQ